MGISTVIFTISIAVIALILSVICLIATIFALIELRSFNKSTHKIEWVPLDAPNTPVGKEPMNDDVLKQYDLAD